MCIGVISALSLISAVVMLLAYPYFPIDDLLPPPKANHRRFGDQQWQEDWTQRWEPDQPEFEEPV